jgi:LCP family protein required for cell wall assembly
MGAPGYPATRSAARFDRLIAILRAVTSDEPPGSGPFPGSAGATGDPGHGWRGRLRARRARRRARVAAHSALRRWLTRGAIAVVLIVVVVVAATAGYTDYEVHQITKIPIPHIVPPTVSGPKGPTENILLIGSTNRCAASSIKQFAVQCQSGVTGINSDVVLVLHLDGDTGKVSLLSIPRDTFVPGARSGSALCGTTSPLTPGSCSNKIDSALVEGPDQLTAAIEQDFGIPINHIVDLNFATFESVVNALGGLWMYFPDRLVDVSSGLDIHHTGCIHLNGSEALELVRARHVFWFTKDETEDMAAMVADNASNYATYGGSGGQYDGTGDLGRILRVHEFLKALATQVSARGLGDPITDEQLISAVAPNLTVDSSLSTGAMVNLALDFRRADLGTAPELTLPTINDAATYYYDGGNYGDVIFPSEPQDQQAIDTFLGAAPAGLRLRPSSISVSVIDGTGSPSATQAVGSQLGALGYKMVPTEASDDVGPVSETTVLYDGPSHLQQAEKVMSSLAGAVVLGQGKPAGGADVSVIAGSLLSVAKVAEPPAGATTTAPGSASTPTTAPATPTSTSSPATSTSTPSTSAPATSAPATSAPASAPAGTTSSTIAFPTTSNPDIGTPTAASTPLPSFDPRSCPTIP